MYKYLNCIWYCLKILAVTLFHEYILCQDYIWQSSVWFFCISADVYDDVSPDIESKGLDCECVGGGRIEHDPVKKKLQIYGYSQASVYQMYL